MLIVECARVVEWHYITYNKIVQVMVAGEVIILLCLDFTCTDDDVEDYLFLLYHTRVHS